jgi:hypothetical protein
MYSELNVIATDLSICWGKKADKLNDWTATESHVMVYLTVLASAFLPLNYLAV